MWGAGRYNGTFIATKVYVTIPVYKGKIRKYEN